MEYTVPTLSIVFIIIDMVMGIAIPVALFVFLKKRYQCSMVAFGIGCAVMFGFALVLEQIVHFLVLRSPAGSMIQGNIWFYGLYGGLMAGLFEETGRLVAFKTVLRKKQYNDNNALMYGAGHGGFELFYILVFGMINNLIISLLMNSGNTEILTAALSGDALTEVENAFALLSGTSSSMFLVSLIERGAALIAQLSLSVLVWFAVKRGGKYMMLYPLAIVAHLLLDAVAVILNNFTGSIVLVECVVWMLALIYAALAYGVWKKQKSGYRENSL